MGRRRGSLIENILTLVARSPWPVGVALAVVSFIGFSILGEAEPTIATSVDEMGSAVVSQTVRTVAPIASYLIPGLFLVGAGASFFAGARRKRILRDAASQSTGVEQLDWRNFERLVHAFFEGRGFRVTDRGGPAADGGVDLELVRNGKRYLVQCKHWRARNVGVQPVRELYGVMTARNADGGFFVTSSAFTAEALYFADGLPIELIDGSILRELLGRQDAGDIAWSAPVRRAIEPRFDPPQPPGCPNCGNRMVDRIAKRGPQAGQRFWGCPSFPRCRGTRAIDASE
ncbi:MAG: restriction endonuclease [Candidatus Wenzhouxiangella sp. M2_3B_020]